jgi:hypothetical protein
MGRFGDSVTWIRVMARLAPVVLGGLTVLGLLAAGRGIMSSGQSFHHEGWILFGILRVRDGLPLYPDYQVYPFNLVLYSPVYYLIVGTLSRVLDLNVDATVTLARISSALATAVSALMIAEIGRLCGLSRLGRMAAVGLFVSCYIIHPWLFSARPDALALACSLAGLWVGLRHQTVRGALVTGMLLALAFHTKQSHVAVAGALLLGTIYFRQFTRTFALAISWSICISVGLAFEHVMSNGLFAANTITPNVLTMRLEFVVKQIGQFLVFGFPSLVLTIMGWPSLRKASFSLTVIVLYALIAVSVGFFATAKIGASYNQLLEAAAVLALFGGRGIERLATLAAESQDAGASTRQSAWRPLAIVLGICAIASSVFPGETLFGHIVYTPDDSALVRLIARMPGDILTERDSLAVVRAGKTPVFADPFGIALLSQDGRWDPSSLHGMIERREFSLIVLATPLDQFAEFDSFPWWPAGTESRIIEHYVLVGQSRTRLFYAPNGDQGAAMQLLRELRPM